LDQDKYYTVHHYLRKNFLHESAKRLALFLKALLLSEGLLLLKFRGYALFYFGYVYVTYTYIYCNMFLNTFSVEKCGATRTLNLIYKY
jgi:hypothetical protein